MRWACRCRSVADAARTNDGDAHGQVAWSWPPDAEVKFAVMRSGARADDGGQQARRTGENAKQPSKPSRGECRDASAEPVVPAACIFFCRRAMGAASARHSPCPLCGRGQYDFIPRAHQRAARSRKHDLQKAGGDDEQQRILGHRCRYGSTGATTANAGAPHRAECRVSASACSGRCRSGSRETARLPLRPVLICISCRSSSAPCPRRPAAGILRWLRRDRNGSCCRPASVRSTRQRSYRRRDRCRRGSGGACRRRRD